jgi:hypothetical protein
MEQLVAALTGPFGALALAVAILVWLAKQIVPMLKSYLDSQSKGLKDMITALEKTVDAHEADRKTFEAALSQIDARLDRVETDIHAIKTKIITPS